MKTIGHVRVLIGDAYLLGAAYRALQAELDAGMSSVSEAGMQRLRAILDDVHRMAESERDVTARPVVSDIWGAAH
jgi:hypothetical protein